MSITSSRNVQVQFSGDVTLQLIQAALDNAVSPGEVITQSLASGANTITAPAVSGITVTSLTIIPPAGNTVQITLKGVAGDTGIPLHLTDPTTISLAPFFSSLVLNAAATINVLRLIWA